VAYLPLESHGESIWQTVGEKIGCLVHCLLLWLPEGKIALPLVASVAFLGLPLWKIALLILVLLTFASSPLATYIYEEQDKIIPRGTKSLKLQHCQTLTKRYKLFSL
jgi:hypothetical protein